MKNFFGKNRIVLMNISFDICICVCRYVVVFRMSCHVDNFNNTAINMTERQIHFISPRHISSLKVFNDNVGKCKLIICIPFSELQPHIFEHALITPTKNAIPPRLQLGCLVCPPREIFGSQSYDNILANHMTLFVRCHLIFIGIFWIIWKL